MGKSGNFPRPSIRFSYAYPHQKLRPKSSAQSSIKTPLKTQNSGVSIEFSEHPKIPMKNFTLSDHENAFVRTRECVYLPYLYLFICIFSSPLQTAFRFSICSAGKATLAPKELRLCGTGYICNIVWEIQTGFLATLHSCEMECLPGYYNA